MYTSVDPLKLLWLRWRNNKQVFNL